MKKKLYVTRTVKVACLLLALMFSCGFLQTYGLRRDDHNMVRLTGYYREKSGSLDVVLLGASEIYTGYSAGRAYEKYGYTSYPVATESITTDGMLLALKEIVRTQHPKLIVIEPNAYLYKEIKNESNDGHIRKLVDNIPLSGNKIEYVTQNIPGDEQIEYYFPMIKYHGMWTDYPKSLFKTASAIEMDFRGAYYLKGFRTTTGTLHPKEKILNQAIINENKTAKLNKVLEKKLVELLEYCKEQKLNVVFVRSPHMVYKKTYERVKRSNRAAEIVRKYGYDYINLEREWDKMGIDLTKDFYNYDHLNAYGAAKLTDYLGNILQTKYGIERRTLSGSEKEEWDTAAEYFGKLYRYCDHLLKANKKEKLDEDMGTLRRIENY